MREWLGLPIAASAQAAPVDQTLVLVHWLMLALFAGWSAFLVYVLVRFRRGVHPRANPSGTRARWAVWVEAGILAAEVALLVLLSVPVVSRGLRPPASPDSVVVRVVAEQFAWNIQYPGADGAFGATDARYVSETNPIGLDPTDPAGRDDVLTINELHLPVGRTTVVLLSSKDVVHSFTLPQMRIKQDVIPGMETTAWFTPVETGNWEITCSQLCGLGHYRMRGLYAIETEADYEAWLTAQPTGLF